MDVRWERERHKRTGTEANNILGFCRGVRCLPGEISQIGQVGKTAKAVKIHLVDWLNGGRKTLAWVSGQDSGSEGVSLSSLPPHNINPMSLPYIYTRSPLFTTFTTPPRARPRLPCPSCSPPLSPSQVCLQQWVILVSSGPLPRYVLISSGRLEGVAA